MKPLMPFAGLALGLLGLIQFANFASDHAAAANKARWDAARVEVERDQQAERDKAQVRLRIALEEDAEKAAIVHAEVARIRKELGIPQP